MGSEMCIRDSTCFSPRASLGKKLLCFKSVEQSSLFRFFEASMGYGRSCSKLLLGLCGRFLVLPGIFPGFASKQQLRLRMGAGSVCARACAHLMCRCGCKYVCVHMRMCICMRACMHLHMVQKCTTLISLTPTRGGTLSEPKNGLGVVFFVFVFCSESNRRKTEV